MIVLSKQEKSVRQLIRNEVKKKQATLFEEGINWKIAKVLKNSFILDFCGNAIELRNQDDEKFLIMSSRAKEALHASQEEFLLNHFKEIIHADLSTIELYGGGSARCMVTELM